MLLAWAVLIWAQLASQARAGGRALRWLPSPHPCTTGLHGRAHPGVSVALMLLPPAMGVIHCCSLLSTQQQGSGKKTAAAAAALAAPPAAAAASLLTPARQAAMAAGGVCVCELEKVGLVKMCSGSSLRASACTAGSHECKWCLEGGC